MVGEKSNISFEITENLGVISANSQTGWQKEINRVSWGDRPPKIDIRDWNPEHTRSSKGLTFTEEEAGTLCDILKDMFS